MRRLLAFAALAAPLLVASASPAASTTLVISEFRTRGPNGANDEFVEIFNKGSTTVSITGYTLRVSDASGTTSLLTGMTGTVSTRHFVLFANGGPQGYSGGTAPNGTYTGSIPDSGGIALLDSQGHVVDAVGTSPTSAYVEGTALAPMSSNVNQSYERNDGDCAATKDSDDNAADFRLNGNRSFPQNASYNCATCQGVVCNSPPSGSGDCWTLPGTCSQGSCVYTAKAVGATCNDGDACTSGDACDASRVCSGSTPTACTPPSPKCSSSDSKTLLTFSGGTCDSASGCSFTQSSTHCDYGCNAQSNVCNPNPCTNVSCPPPAATSCLDTGGSCDTSTGACVYPKKSAGTSCSDDLCKTGKKCDANGQCTGGTPVDVDDSNPCTTDTCDPATGKVVHTSLADGASCDDGDKCNGVALCNGGKCVNGDPVTCNTPAAGGCTQPTGTCTPSTGKCVYQPLDAATSCNDGDTCTVSDQCDGNGSCVGSTKPCPAPGPECVGGKSRTYGGGACDAGSGSCTFTHTDKDCAFGCDGPSGLCKNDPCIGVVCNHPQDACHESVGTCSNGECTYALKAPGSACDDGNPCTAVDQCSAAGACAGTPLLCNTPTIQASCTDSNTSLVPEPAGTCDKGSCTYIAVQSTCTAGCNAANGTCNDDPCAGKTCDEPNDPCRLTNGSCNASGVCEYARKPAGSSCKADEVCTTSFVCSADGTCAGTPVECNAPPSPTCVDGKTSKTYDAAGTCSANGCEYTATTHACAKQCVTATGLCDDDPCSGVVCNQPPGICSLDVGTCENGTCKYAPRAGKVPCDDGNVCTTGDVCDGAGTCAGTPVCEDGGLSPDGGQPAASGGAGGAGNEGSGGKEAATGGRRATTDAGAAVTDAGADAAPTGSFSSAGGSGCGCTMAREANAAAWPLSLLAMAALMVRRKKTR